MNCDEAQHWLQRQLDGEPVTERAALEAHCAACPACRERFVAAERLIAGLRLRQTPGLPFGLSERIVRRVLHDGRRKRRVRRLAVGVALAASLLLAVGLVAG